MGGVLVCLACLFSCGRRDHGGGGNDQRAEGGKPAQHGASAGLLPYLPPGFRLPPGVRTNQHIVVARYGTTVEVPGSAGAIRFQRPPPGIRIKLDDPAMSGEEAAMYFFDAVMLKEQFAQGDSAEYVASPVVQAKTFDARLGWLTPDEIIDKLGALFAAQGVALLRVSPTIFVALPASELPPGPTRTPLDSQPGSRGR
jgi:hypothetical protein